MDLNIRKMTNHPPINTLNFHQYFKDKLSSHQPSHMHDRQRTKSNFNTPLDGWCEGGLRQQRNDGGGCATMRERPERVESPGT